MGKPYKETEDWTEADETWFQNFMTETMNAECEAFMEEVNADPEVRDAVPPPDMFDKIMERIRENEKRSGK